MCFSIRIQIRILRRCLRFAARCRFPCGQHGIKESEDFAVI